MAVDRSQRVRDVVERSLDRTIVAANLEGQAVGVLEGGDDGRLVRVQLPHEGAELGQHRAHLRLAALQGVVQLGEDRLELADATTVEQQRERAEHLFDLGVATGAVQPDLVAVRQLAGAGSLGSLSWTNLSPRRLVCRISARALSGSLTSPGYLEGDLGDVALEVDLLHLADGDVVDPDRRLRTRSRTSRNITLIVIGLSPVWRRRAVVRRRPSSQRAREPRHRPASVRTYGGAHGSCGS